MKTIRRASIHTVYPLRRVGRSRYLAALWPYAAILVLSALFLWRPILTGTTFLPTDLSYRYDYMWKIFPGVPLPAGFTSPTGISSNGVLSDVALYYYPYERTAVEELRSGHFPLWNPYILTGTPLFASTQAAVLDPVNLVAYLAGPYNYWTWAAWLRLALLGIGTFLFMRILGRGPIAGMAAGVVFMTCGFVTAWLNYNVVTTLTWLPLLMWATVRMLRTGQAVWAAVAGAILGCLLLGGHPETQFLGALLWGAFSLYYLFGLRRQRVPCQSEGPVPSRGHLARRVGQLVLVACLGLALSAVQQMPFLDFLLRTGTIGGKRTAAIPAPDLARSAFQLAVLFLPNFSGTPLMNNYWYPSTLGLNFNEQTGYIGLLALLLAALAVPYWWPRDRQVRFFCLAGLLGLLLALRTPGLHLVSKLPLFNVGPGIRWLIVFSFCGAVLTGYAVEALVLMPPGLRYLRMGAAWLSGGALLGLVSMPVVYLGVSYGHWDRAWGVPESHNSIAGWLKPGHLPTYWPVFFLVAGAVVVVARYRGWLRAPATATLLILLLYADLWVFGSRYNPITPARAVYPATETVQYLQAHIGHDRFAGESNMMRPDLAMLFGLRDVRGYEDLVDQTFDTLYRGVFTDLQANRQGDIVLSPADRRLLQVAGVRYVLSPRKLRVPGEPGAYRAQTDIPPQSIGRVTVYEDVQPLPRSYLVYSATICPDLETSTQALLSPVHDPRRTVILTEAGTQREGTLPSCGAAELPGGAGLMRPAQSPLAATPAWQQDGPDQVALRASLPVPGYLVLVDNYAPGWQATVDGHEVHILRANVAFRAISLPAGPHTVVFAYRAPLLYPGAIFSGLGVVVVLGLALGTLRSTSGRRANGQ